MIHCNIDIHQAKTHTSRYNLPCYIIEHFESKISAKKHFKSNEKLVQFKFLCFIKFQTKKNSSVSIVKTFSIPEKIYLLHNNHDGAITDAVVDTLYMS